MPSTTARSNTRPPQAKGRAAISNEVKLDPKDPIPFEQDGAAFTFARNVSYLPFLAPQDNFGQQLLEAAKLSTTQGACIGTKADYCAGNGFYDIDGGELADSIISWFKSMNKKNESIKKLLRKQFSSHFTFGNTPVEVVRFTVAGKKKLFIYVHNFLEWRLCKPVDDDVVTHAIQSKLFVRRGYITGEELKNSKKLPIYNPMNTEKQNWFTDEKGVQRTLIWYKQDAVGFPHYGLPDSVESLIYQVLEYKGARFDLDLFENDLVIGGIIALQASMTEQEATKVAKRVVSTHSGDGRKGRWVVVSSEDGIKGSDIHQFDTNRDGSYLESDDKWMQKIILSHRWDATLAGLVNTASLGKGSEFLTKIIQLKEATMIKPAQQDAIDEVWSHIFTIAEEWLGLPFSGYNLAIKPFMDISALSDIDPTPVVMTDELRAANGLPPIGGEKGKLLVGELKGKQLQPTKKGGEDVPEE